MGSLEELMLGEEDGIDWEVKNAESDEGDKGEGSPSIAKTSTI